MAPPPRPGAPEPPSLQPPVPRRPLSASAPARVAFTSSTRAPVPTPCASSGPVVLAAFVAKLRRPQLPFSTAKMQPHFDLLQLVGTLGLSVPGLDPGLLLGADLQYFWESSHAWSVFAKMPKPPLMLLRFPGASPLFLFSEDESFSLLYKYQ